MILLFFNYYIYNFFNYLLKLMNSSNNFNYTNNKTNIPREIPTNNNHNEIYNLKSNSLNQNNYYQFLTNNDKNQENNPNKKIYDINDNIIENDEEYNIIRKNIQILQQKISNMGNLNNKIQDNYNFIIRNSNINSMNNNINYNNNNNQISNIENKGINNNNKINYEFPFYNPLIGNNLKFDNENINLKDSINDSSINESINLSILAEEIVKAFELDNSKKMNDKSVIDKRVDFIEIQKQLNQIKQNIENFQIKDINDKNDNLKLNLKSNYINSSFKNGKQLNENYQNKENFLISNYSNNNHINDRYDDKNENIEYKKIINNQITTIKEINEDDENGIEENYFIDNDLTNYNDSQRYEKYNPIHSIILEVSENKECSEILPKDELKNSISFLKESNCNLNKNITQGRISEYTENQENNNSLDNLKLSIIKSNELNSSQKLKSSFLRENNKINESKNFIDDDSDEETDMILNQIIQTAKNQELMEKEEKKNS